MLEVLFVEIMPVEHELYCFCGDQDLDLFQHNQCMQELYSSGPMQPPIWDQDSGLRMPLSMLVLVPMSLGLQLVMLGTSMIGGLAFEPLPDQLLPDPALLEHFSDLELVELELVGLDVVDLAGCNPASQLCVPLVCGSLNSLCAIQLDDDPIVIDRCTIWEVVNKCRIVICHHCWYSLMVNRWIGLQ